jgi:hypothetical protein
MKLCFRVFAICLAVVLVLWPLSATAVSVDGDLNASDISGEYEEESEAESYNVQENELIYEKEQVPEAVSDDAEEDTTDSLQGEDATEPSNLSSIDTDALTAWVSDNPDKLSALYKGDTTAIASLSEFLTASEELVSSYMSDLKAQNDIIVKAIEKGTDVLGIISSDTAEDAADKLGVNAVAINLFSTKVDYVSSLLNAEIEESEKNGNTDAENQKLGKALGDEDELSTLASSYDVEPAVLGAILQSMGIESIVSTSLTITNVELDIPEGVNDNFTYQIFLWSTSANGTVNALTGYYGDTYFRSQRLYYTAAYSYGIPYNSYYTTYGYTTVTLSAGGTVKIPDLPEGCSYMILVSASANYYVKSVECTYGTVDDQIGTVSVTGASGPNNVVCTNDYAPHSLRLSEEVMSSDPDSVNDEFTFKIYLYSHGSSKNSPLFSGDSVKVSITTDGRDGAEAPNLGNTLTFTTTESITLPGLSIPGTYNVATVTLKHGQSIVLQNLGSDYGCYIYQEPVIHYMLYTLKSRHVYTNNLYDFVGSYDNYYNYIDSCSVSSSVGFVNAQETLSITKKVVGSDTTRKFVFNVYLLQYYPDSDRYAPMREGTFNLSYTNPTGNEPKTVDIGLRSDISKETTLTEGVNGTSYTARWSVAQVQVAAGQTVTIEELPAAIAYYIEEVPVDNYTLTGATTSSGGTVKDNYDVYNLLSLSDESFTFTNTYVPPVGNDLSVSKTVTGSMGDKNRSFTFCITLKDQSDSPLSDEDIQVLLPGASDATIYTTDKNGSITLSLKHGDEVTLQNLPQGTEYTITETDADDYTTDFSVSGGTYRSSSNRTLSGKLTDSTDVSVSVTNDKKLVVPTGISTENEPFLLMLSFSAVTILLMIVVKKRKAHR